MKLWLLRPREDVVARRTDNPWEPWFDKLFGLVVRAEDEAKAREIAQAGGSDEAGGYTWSATGWGQYTMPAWTDPKYSTCEELTADGEEGVILTEPHSA